VVGSEISAKQLPPAKTSVKQQVDDEKCRLINVQLLLAGQSHRCTVAVICHLQRSSADFCSRQTGLHAKLLETVDHRHRMCGNLTGAVDAQEPLLRSANHRSSVLMVRDLAIDGIFGSPLRFFAKSKPLYAEVQVTCSGTSRLTELWAFVICQ
jgi:hypothetical protein